MKKESKIIIGIHGLGNKPPKNVLENWWKQSIIDGLRYNNFKVTDFDFVLIYWADILHPTPIEISVTNTSPEVISEVYSSEEYTERNKPLNYREKAFEYLEKYYNNFIINEVLTLKYPAITEFFIHLHLRDLKTYYSTEPVFYCGKKSIAKDAIVDRFAKTINNYSGKKIFLIAHSMGSLISHDAFLEQTTSIPIDSLVTIGSPLGQKYVINKYNAEGKQNSINKFRVPENILKNWYNLSDLQDQVAINHEISNLYQENSGKVKIIDQLVENKFISGGVRNPHKAFGYLRTPEFSKIINEFLTEKSPGFFEQIRNYLRGKR
ncbi:MAG TPA: hypothetical protein VF270_10530 [Ignavibacteriaceae bacterium]